MAGVPLSAARQLVADRLAEGDPEDALALVRGIAERFPRDCRAATLAGRAHLARGDVAAARAELERVAAALPDERDAWADLAACSSDRAASLLADLPPLPSSDGERPAISAAALGHLYLRQLLLTHCTAQLEPVWSADPSRLDVGVALAEAHWRLGEVEPAESICRDVLRASPDCLKANLILAQVLCASGRNEEAAPSLALAEAVDPENVLAAELYQWLAVRDPALVPLRAREVTIDLDREPPTLEAPPEPVPFWERLAAEAQEPEPEPAPTLQLEPEPEPEPEAEPGAPAEPEPTRAAEPLPAEADIAATAPEPALAEVEVEAERSEVPAVPLVPLRWLKLTPRGRLEELASPSAAWSERALAWNESCRTLGERLKLGALRASSVDSSAGAVQLMHEEAATTIALAPAGGNLGFVRSRLRTAPSLKEQ